MKKHSILTFDTSNYKTSAALLFCEELSYRFGGLLLNVEAGQKGLRQQEALFLHIKQLPLVAEMLGSVQPNMVAVSSRPRDLEGSYMPCFLAGQSFGQSMATLLDLPYMEFSHQQGHIAAGVLSANAFFLLKQTFFAWHVSGGTTELVCVTLDDDKNLKTTILGGSLDISMGQLIDRTAVALGLGFPGGPALEKMAQSSQSKAFFKVKCNDGYFSLSGIENKVQEQIKASLSGPDIARFVFNTVAYTLATASRQKTTARDELLFCGGVMANADIRKTLLSECSAHFASPELSGDNSVGIGVLAGLKQGWIDLK